MSSKNLTAEERTERRANWEAFSFAVPTAGKVNIQNNSYSADDARDHVYTVSVDERGHETTDAPVRQTNTTLGSANTATPLRTRLP